MQGIVRRTVESGPRTVVIHAESAADIEVFKGVPHLGHLRIKTGRLAHRSLDRPNVRHLGTDVKMNELERVGQPLPSQHLTCRDQFRRAHAKLRVLTAAGRPLSGAFRGEPHANSDHRFDADFLRDAQYFPQFLNLLHHHDDFLPQLAPQQAVLDEERILVAVANDQALRVAVHRQRGDQLRLAPRLDSKMKRAPRVRDLLHHLAQLVHLDREHPAIGILVARFRDGGGERLVDRLHPVAQEILEAQDQRKSEPAGFGVLDDVHHIDFRGGIPRGQDLNIALFVDRKIARSPAIDIVEGDGGGNVPGWLHWRGY